MSEIKLGALTLTGTPDDNRGLTRVRIDGDEWNTNLAIHDAEWLSLVNLATVIDAAHKTIETNAAEIRRLDFALAAARRQAISARESAAIRWLVAVAESAGDGEHDDAIESLLDKAHWASKEDGHG
jgi:hypothetical protein